MRESDYICSDSDRSSGNPLIKTDKPGDSRAMGADAVGMLARTSWAVTSPVGAGAAISAGIKIRALTAISATIKTRTTRKGAMF